MKKKSKYRFVSNSGHGCQYKLEVGFLDRRYALEMKLRNELEENDLLKDNKVDINELVLILTDPINRKWVGEMSRLKRSNQVKDFLSKNKDYPLVDLPDHLEEN